MSTDLQEHLETTTNGDLLAILESAQPVERTTFTDDDGWIIDTESGEVLGRVDAPDEFVVDNADKAEWVLRLMSTSQGRLVGLQAQRKAVNEQFDALEQAERRHLSFLDWKFSPSLIQFARSILKGKSKTAQFVWGKISFRATGGTSEILDMDAAVAWMKTWKPGKVKTKEHVNKTDVLEVRAGLAVEFGEAPEHLNWLRTTEPGENVKISTGIEIKGVGTTDRSKYEGLMHSDDTRDESRKD